MSANDSCWGRATTWVRTELDIARHAEEDVVALDVSVDDAVIMEVAKALARLARDGCNLSLSHQVAGDDVGKRAALHVLHDDPEIAATEVNNGSGSVAVRVKVCGV